MTASLGLGLSTCRQLARQMGGDLIYGKDIARSVATLTMPALVG